MDKFYAFMALMVFLVLIYGLWSAAKEEKIKHEISKTKPFFPEGYVEALKDGDTLFATIAGRLGDDFPAYRARLLLISKQLYEERKIRLFVFKESDIKGNLVVVHNMLEFDKSQDFSEMEKEAA